MNKRALGQARRYMNANARKQSEQDIGGTQGIRSQVSSVNSPDCRSKSLESELVDEDRTIAESTSLILMDIQKGAVPLVSCEQPIEFCLPEFEEQASEQPWTIDSTETVRKATSIQQEYCLKLLWQYVTETIAFKARRDRNVTHEYGCTVICGFCLRDTLPALNCFHSVGALKDHIVFMHSWEQYESERYCVTDNRSGLDGEEFSDHVEGCMLQWMKKRTTEDPIRCRILNRRERLQIFWL